MIEEAKTGNKPIQVNLEGRMIFEEKKPEPKAAPAPVKEEDKRNFFARHPYLIATAAIAIPGIAVTIATSKTVPTVVEGTVLEEKYVASMSYATERSTIASDLALAEKEAEASPTKVTVEKTKKPEDYLLHLKVYEPTEEGTTERLCTLYVKEDDKMPVAVLDEAISPGSKVYLHYYGKGVALHSADPVYPLGCFGMIPSSELRVVSAWESSETVKKSLEGHLEELQKLDLERAKLEAQDQWGALVMYDP